MGKCAFSIPVAVPGCPPRRAHPGTPRARRGGSKGASVAQAFSLCCLSAAEPRGRITDVGSAPVVNCDIPKLREKNPSVRTSISVRTRALNFQLSTVNSRPSTLLTAWPMFPPGGNFQPQASHLRPLDPSPMFPPASNLQPRTSYLRPLAVRPRDELPTSSLQLPTSRSSKSSRTHSYEKCARKSFGIHSYKIIRLKVSWNQYLQKMPEGPLLPASFGRWPMRASPQSPRGAAPGASPRGAGATMPRP